MHRTEKWGGGGGRGKQLPQTGGRPGEEKETEGKNKKNIVGCFSRKGGKMHSREKCLIARAK